MADPFPEPSSDPFREPFPEPFREPFPEPMPVGVTSRRPPRRRRRLRWVLLVLAVVLVLTSGGGVYLYQQLNANIRHVPLYAGTTGNAGKEKPDPFGRLPINILVIGSDTRSTKSDCKLGGDCQGGGAGANADVEMVVHVSADRTNMTVMSVPRDLVTELPGCTDPATGAKVGARYAQINSSLTYGPGCTVAAVHQLTGIPIDHFVMVDFAGVISMSDSVGGVQVCVTNNVFDTYSRLKLSRGKHVLKGLAALQFVRSRHAFGDGSDLGRTYAQHAFLSAAIRSLKRTGVLLNPADVYSLAEAATKALTVDTALGSIPKLLGLATDLNKVPTDRITFVTMQTGADPQNVNRVVITTGATALFQTIIDDQSLTVAHPGKSTATPSSAVAPSPNPTVGASKTDVSKIAVQVRNGSGQPGRAAAITAALITKGFSKRTSSGNGTSAAGTTVSYGPGEQAQAQALAKVLKLPTSALSETTTAGVTLLIGKDWLTGTTYPVRSAKAKAATRKAALNQAHSQTGQTSSCVPVSPYKTVVINGIPMTPTRAFSDSPGVKLSAP